MLILSMKEIGAPIAFMAVGGAGSTLVGVLSVMIWFLLEDALFLIGI